MDPIFVTLLANANAREVAGSIPKSKPSLWEDLKNLWNEGTAFALQKTRPSQGSDDHVKWVPSPKEDVKIVSLISTFKLNTLILSAFIFSQKW